MEIVSHFFSSLRSSFLFNKHTIQMKMFFCQLILLNFLSQLPSNAKHRYTYTYIQSCMRTIHNKKNKEKENPNGHFYQITCSYRLCPSSLIDHIQFNLSLCWHKNNCDAICLEISRGGGHLQKWRTVVSQRNRINIGWELKRISFKVQQ